MATSVIIVIVLILIVIGSSVGIYFATTSETKSVDCETSTWSTCNPKTSTRSRIILSPASNGGKECGPLIESCTPSMVKVDCVESSWSVCDPETKTKKRTIKTPASNGGKECGPLTESCAPIPVDCKWGGYSECKPDIDGKYRKTREKTTEASNGGKECEGEASELCSVPKQYGFLPGWDYPGNDIEYYPGASIQECRTNCDQDSTCKGFYHNSDGCGIKYKLEGGWKNPALNFYYDKTAERKSASGAQTVGKEAVFNIIENVRIKNGDGNYATLKDTVGGSPLYFTSKIEDDKQKFDYDPNTNLIYSKLSGGRTFCIGYRDEGSGDKEIQIKDCNGSDNTQKWTRFENTKQLKDGKYNKCYGMSAFGAGRWSWLKECRTGDIWSSMELVKD